MQLFLQWPRRVQQVAGVLQGADGVIGRLRAVTTAEQFFEGRIALGPANHRRDFCAELVRRTFVATTQREHDHPQQTTQHPVREVAQQLIECALGLTQAFFHGPGKQRCHMLR
ncbi:hypothetical protein D3C84_902900 [compost metagenome]